MATYISRTHADHEAKPGFARKGAQFCCILSLVLASADIWPTITAGFTFRLPQILIPACVLLLAPTLQHNSIKAFPGSIWCLLWILWTILSLPFSLYVDRSLGYAFWLVTNLLIIFVFVQSFRDAEDGRRLINWFLAAFLIQSAFGVVQLLCGMVGIDLLVSEWWVIGRLPRVNGLTYEPSYYATYLLPGWVFSLYLLERKQQQIRCHRLVAATAFASTVALIISSSRIGWGLMFGWISLRLIVYLLRFIAGHSVRIKVIKRSIYAVLFLPVVAFLVSELAPTFVDRLADTAMFALSGIGVFGTASHSADARSSGVSMTLNAFLAHPILGTGLGAVPVEIAGQQGSAVNTLEDAKANEGMSVIIETAASIGLIGLVVSVGFLVCVLMRFTYTYLNSSDRQKALLGGIAWALVWLLLALQFNQNFLRIYVWMDIAVAIALVEIFANSRLKE